MKHRSASISYDISGDGMFVRWNLLWIIAARSELRKVLFLALSETFLSVYEICREPLNGFATYSHGRRVWSLARTSLKVQVIGKLSDERHALYVILYADDILLLSPSVSRLQKLLHDCEDEFEYLDMNINTTKTACLLIGPRSDKTCINLTTKNGSEILWVKEIRYLGIYIVRSTRFSCNLDHAKRSFYRALNGIFAKIGRLASEEVFLQLIYVRSVCQFYFTVYRRLLVIQKKHSVSRFYW